MNHIYRSIWNESTGTVTAVSEHAKRGGKKRSSEKNAVVSPGFVLRSVSVAVALALGSNTHAAPTGGTVVAGNASIASTPGNTTINQSSQNAVLNWQSFDVGVTESVRFVQPNRNSVALNRVLGADASNILGNLSANGKVFLINPNGILFGKGAQVNVGGLVASTRNISDSDFMAGRYTFTGDSNADVLNQGAIHADGGYVALLGAHVSNEGVIAARLGSVALAAGDALTLDVAGDGLLNVTVNAGSVDALVRNGGVIRADGGQVLMTTQSASSLLEGAVNNTGLIQAQTVENRNGVIRLLGDMQSGTVYVRGTLDASAPNGGDGGFVDTSAAHVKVANDARITTAAARGLTGSWLIDPTDYTIAASGGDITGAALSANLATGNVTILSTSGTSGAAGDVNVNDTVTWSANTLTLNAQNDININRAVHASGTASLALEYGQGAVAAGNTSTVNVNAPIDLPSGNDHLSKRLGSDGAIVRYTVINSLGAEGSTTGTDLQGMNGNVADNYALGANIDATATSGWEGGAGFAPVQGFQLVGNNYGGTDTIALPFTGNFDGLGHTISGLTINRPSAPYGGLFGLTSAAATIRNVGLVGGSVMTNYNVGSLVGRNEGAIDNTYSSATVIGDQINGLNAGGLVASNYGAISNSYATGAVTAGRNVGGLVGKNQASITGSHASGAVTAGTYYSGGLVGRNYGASGPNEGTNYGASSISDSYATGSVSGGKNGSGGLLGANYGSVARSYATGSVTNDADFVGGLVGVNSYIGTITLAYSTGHVSGHNNVGGLTGFNFNSNPAISNSYWNTDTSGQATSGGGTGLTSVQMQTAASFASFNFTTTPGAAGNNWVMVDVDGGLNNAGGSLGATLPMLASEYSTMIADAHQLQLMAMNRAASYTLTRDIDATATGTANDVWSGSTFMPVGNHTATFTGTLDGLGHTIGNLTINRPASTEVGLFGFVDSGGLVQNVGLVGGSVIGQVATGALVGENIGTVRNSYATTSVSGHDYVGGLVGYNLFLITASYATGTVTSDGSGVGGLVGINQAATVSDSYATGAVTTTGFGGSAGGLAGINYYGTINDSFATGAVTGYANVGGLVGRSEGGTGGDGYGVTSYDGTPATINGSYATGAVSGTLYVGGLVGLNIGGDGGGGNPDTFDNPGTGGNGGAAMITNSYATGAVNGSSYSGGLVGANLAGRDGTGSGAFGYGGLGGVATVDRSYASGAVTAGLFAGGLVGMGIDAAVTASFWDVTTSGQVTSAGGIGMTTADMQTQANFTSSTAANGSVNPGWDFSSDWVLFEGHTSPLLRSLMTALTVTVNDVTKTYDGLAYAGSNGVTYSTTPNGNLFGTVSYSGTSQGAINAGSYDIGASGLYSNQQGYLISYVDGALTVNKAELTVSTADVRKTYDGGLTAGGTTVLVGGTLFGTDALSGGTFDFTDKNAGSGNKTVTTAGVTVIGTNNGGNYNVSYVDNTTSTIDPALLTVTASAADKIYDGNTSASTTLSIVSGLVNGETIAASGAATFNSKNVLDANLVTVNSISLADGTNGGLASNYTLASGQTAAAHITPKALVVVDSTVSNKVYDGTTAATVSGGSLVGVVTGETVALNEAGTFATANAGKGISVTTTDNLNGSAAVNYTITQPTGLTADITAAVGPETPPVAVITTTRYQDAVSHAYSSAAIAPVRANSVSAPVSLGSTAGGSNAGGTLSTNLAGLNLTVLDQGVNSPFSVPQENTSDDK